MTEVLTKSTRRAEESGARVGKEEFKKLRDEWCEQHLDHYYSKVKNGHRRRLRHKPRQRRPVSTDNTQMYSGLFDDFVAKTTDIG